jgi:hypothetical protein
MKRVLLIAVLMLSLGLALGLTIRRTERPAIESKRAVAPVASESDLVWARVTNLVSGRLLSPAVAIFDRTRFAVVDVAGRKAMGTVNSQNIYGAMLSERFEVDLERPETEWRAKFWSEDSPILKPEQKIWR